MSDAGSHSSSDRIAWLRERLELAPHPEGGYYRRVFESAALVQPDDGRPPRRALTTIYYLLPAGQRSQWHRVASDEAWCWLEGAELELRVSTEGATAPSEAGTDVRLGPVGDGIAPVHVVPRNCWQSARSLGSYTLVACAVGPGFDFDDFTLLDDLPGQ